MKILYAEDEPAMSEAVSEALRRAGYVVDTAFDGREADDMLSCGEYDAAILDVMMPGRDGLSVLERMRKRGDMCPCLLLTARDQIPDRISGLDAGADDYLSKPFAMGELLARVRAMLRRGNSSRSSYLPFGDLILDPGACQLRCGNKSVSLGAMEFRVAETLFDARGSFISADDILDRASTMESEAGIDTIRVYISGLRKKIRSIDSTATILSKRDVGYRLDKGNPDNGKTT